LTSATQAEKLSWKTTTMFMESSGCLGYIFGEPGRNGMLELTVVLMERSFWNIKKCNTISLLINDNFLFQLGVIASIYELADI
jgi:hypothetical protein